MTVDERARAGLFLAMQYPVEVPGVSVSNFLRTAATAIRGEAPKLRTWVKEVKERDGAPADGPGLRRAQRQRGLLRRREEAPRDPSARAAQAEDRDPRRDRLRPRRRRAARRLRGRQPGPRDRRGRHPADHPLHAHPALHQARLRPRLRRPAGSSSPAAPSSPTSWRTRATRPTRRVGAVGATRDAGQLPGLLDTEAIRKDFPDPGPAGPRRQEARVPGQRGDLAEAAPGARRAERVLRAAQRQRPPRRARARRGGHGAVRGRPRQGRRRSSTRRAATR